MPSLVLFPRPGVRTRLFNIYRRITTIGSATDNDIVLEGEGVEPNHCQVFFDGKKYQLTALDRAAEMDVNGKRTRKATLQDQDVLKVGPYTLQFSIFDLPSEDFKSQPTPHKDSLRKLLEFTTALMEQRDLQTLIDLMLDQLLALTGADKGFLFLLDGDSPTLHCSRNVERECLALSGDGFSDSIVRHVIQSGQPLLISDAMHHTQFRESRSVVDLKLCSVMCAPLLCRSDMVGVIYLGNDNVVNLFDQEALDVLRIFASSAGLLVRNAILINELTVRKQELEQELETIKFGEIIGSSRSMLDIYKKIEKVATTDISVLIRGETGTGKELIAREIHQRSNRASGPFIALNCGAIPENLLESELFGHEKGAYTGAHAAAQGKFQAAHRGTLLLDEIGDLPYPLQAKILRAIETKQVTRVGATRPEEVDLRIVAATNRNLEEAVARGTFRQDLYFRLNVVTIHMPSLAERGEDVTLIANYFFQKFSRQYGGKARGFSARCLAAMRSWRWPGNVRELENRIRKAMVLGEKEMIEPEDLEILEQDVRILPLAEAKENFQKEYVAKVLELNRGNKTKTARDLGVDPRTIFRYFEKERPEGE